MWKLTQVLKRFEQHKVRFISGHAQLLSLSLYKDNPYQTISFNNTRYKIYNTKELGKKGLG